MTVWNFVRRRVYHDSVTLMRLAREMEAVAGVSAAAAMMGTPSNRDLLRQAGLLAAEGEAAGPTDLVIAVRARSAEAAAAAAAAAEQALAARPPAPGMAAGAPRTLGAAARALPDASLALISVPGAYAGAEAMKALQAGLHVMLFSDNVPLETEIALKREAAVRDRLVMGPDCGTAIVAGVPLGFANAVPRGRIGLAGASGTGLQEITCLLADAGEGVSHAIGVGGRDLTDAVGGATMRRALAALAGDSETAVIVVVGKTPGAATAARLAGELSGLSKPCVVHWTGGAPAVAPRGVHAAATLEDAATAAVALARGASPVAVEFTAPPEEVKQAIHSAAATLRAGQRYVRGLYAGGTLAWEAVGLLAAALDDVAPGVTGGGVTHHVIDLGDDAFTVGRPHPMIDGTVRRDAIARQARDPGTAVLLLDVVLGYGAHPDPVGEIVPALDAARAAASAGGRGLAVVASVTGTEADPQCRSAQVAALRGRGVVVMPSNAQAARLAARIAAAVAGH